MPVLKKKLSDDQFKIAVNDKRLPLKVRGMLATLQTMPTGTEFTLEELSDNMPDGYTSLLSYVRQLEVAGYLERVRIYGEQGHITHTEYLLFCDGEE